MLTILCSTVTSIYTTRVRTETSLARVTPSTTYTTTVTVYPQGQATRRDAAPEITDRAELKFNFEHVVAEYNRRYRRQDAGDSSDGNSTASMRSAFSSACSCQDYGGPTVTVTYTDETQVRIFTIVLPGITNQTERLQLCLPLALPQPLSRLRGQQLLEF